MKSLASRSSQFAWAPILSVLMALGAAGLVGCRSIKPAPYGTSRGESPNSAPNVTVIVSQESPSPPDAAVLQSTPIDSPALMGAPRYDINLTIDYESGSFQGRSRLNYTNDEGVPLEALYFRLLPNGGGSYGNGSLKVTSTLVNNQTVETQLSLNDTVLQLELPEPLSHGEELEAAFEFEGQATLDFGEDSAPQGYGIYNLSQGVLALSGWYPILAVYDDNGWNLDPVSDIGDSVYSDVAFYHVEAAIPNSLVIAGTGVEVERQASGEQTLITFESGPARDFFLALSPDFQVVSQVVDGTTVNSYYLPEHEAGGHKALSVTVDSLSVFSERFGPYPYAELDVIEGPMKRALGVEYPGAFMVSVSLYSVPEKPEFVVTTAHEVAHQWWYNVVGNDVFEEPWLDEALATYSSSLYYEFRPDGQAPLGLIDYWQDRYDALLLDGKDDLITGSLEYYESLDEPRVYGGVVYNKGALFFDALRAEIDDQAFFEALKDYYQTYQYQIASAEDLLSSFERAAGRELDAFYQQWLYSKEVPPP